MLESQERRCADPVRPSSDALISGYGVQLSECDLGGVRQIRLISALSATKRATKFQAPATPPPVHIVEAQSGDRGQVPCCGTAKWSQACRRVLLVLIDLIDISKEPDGRVKYILNDYYR
jgi:hypothetical protein